MEASVVIGSCASAPPLPLRPVRPGQGGSWRGLLRCSAGFSVAGCAQTPGGRLSRTFQFNQPIFCPGGSHSWAELPGERKTGAGTLLPACGPERCPESKSFSLTATPSFVLNAPPCGLRGDAARKDGSLRCLQPCCQLKNRSALCQSSHLCPPTALK